MIVAVIISYLLNVINLIFTIFYWKFLKATENLLANLDVSAPQGLEEEKRNLDQHHRELQMTADGLNERIRRPILFEQKYHNDDDDDDDDDDNDDDDDFDDDDGSGGGDDDDDDDDGDDDDEDGNGDDDELIITY